MSETREQAQERGICSKAFDRTHPYAAGYAHQKTKVCVDWKRRIDYSPNEPKFSNVDWTPFKYRALRPTCGNPMVPQGSLQSDAVVPTAERQVMPTESTTRPDSGPLTRQPCEAGAVPPENPAEVPQAQVGGPESGLREKIVAMMTKRGWSMSWIHRSAYLHLEAAELAEAVRGKRGDPLDESADVLITLLALSPFELDAIVAAAHNKVNLLMVKPPYAGEQGTTEARASRTKGEQK